jgi:hypothetical protein
MLKLEIFISEFGSAVNGTTSRAITVDEVTTLDHEIFNLEMRRKRRRWLVYQPTIASDL